MNPREIYYHLREEITDFPALEAARVALKTRLISGLDHASDAVEGITDGWKQIIGELRGDGADLLEASSGFFKGIQVEIIALRAKRPAKENPRSSTLL